MPPDLSGLFRRPAGPGPAQAGRPVATTIAGRYRLLEEIGRGGMAAVWRGQDESLQRMVAVKVPNRRYVEDPSTFRRLRSTTPARFGSGTGFCTTSMSS